MFTLQYIIIFVYFTNFINYNWSVAQSKIFQTGLIIFWGLALSQAVSRFPLTFEGRVRFQVSHCEISGGQSGTGTSLWPCTSVCPSLLIFVCTGKVLELSKKQFSFWNRRALGRKLFSLSLSCFSHFFMRFLVMTPGGIFFHFTNPSLIRQTSLSALLLDKYFLNLHTLRRLSFPLVPSWSCLFRREEPLNEGLLPYLWFVKHSELAR
jgi:hypothetical protein